MMKKIILFVVVLALAMSWTVSVFANFVPSIHAKPAPELVEAVDDSDKDLVVIMVAFADIDKLPEDAKAIMQEAYDEIVNAKHLAKLNRKLKKLAKATGVDVEDLIVSDFFDLSDTSGQTVEGNYNITLEATSLKNFFVLLHYTDGDWEIVDNASVSDDGKELSFAVDGLSPFAIVNATAVSAVQRTPVPVVLWVLLGVLIGALADMIVIFILEKKAAKVA